MSAAHRSSLPATLPDPLYPEGAGHGGRTLHRQFKDKILSQKKDKQKVLGETFDEERIAGFLIGEAPEGVERDYHLLERAYRSMKAENFETFVRLFLEQNLDLNSPGPDGRSLLARIREHRQSEEYAEILKAAGAKS